MERALLRSFVLMNLTFVALTGCVQTADEVALGAARPSEWARPVVLGKNLFQIDPLLYRSEQLASDDIALLKSLGIRTIISFRGFHSDENVLSAPGITLVRVPIHAWNINDSHMVSALNAIMQARQNGAVLIHCQHGADRTGLVSAMYRMVYEGWSKDAALDELINGGYGYHSIWTNIPQYIKQVDIGKLRQQMRYAPTLIPERLPLPSP